MRKRNLLKIPHTENNPTKLPAVQPPTERNHKMSGMWTGVNAQITNVNPIGCTLIKQSIKHQNVRNLNKNIHKLKLQKGNEASKTNGYL